MSLLYVRTAKTASSTVNDWMGRDYSLNVTHNIKFLNHGSNEKLIRRAMEEGWYFFTTVRNPFTRAISQWQESIKSLWLNKDTSFEEYFDWNYLKINEHCHTHNCTLTEYLKPYLGDIKRIIKIENLDNELRTMEQEFNIPKRRIGFFNKANYRTRFDYQSFYTDKRIELVLDKYSIDFDTFQYSKNVVDILYG